MANYAEGNIRLRGKRENLIDFIQNEIVYYVPSEKTPNGEKQMHVTTEELCDGWLLNVKQDPVGIKERESYLFYFRKSRRQFIEHDYYSVGLEFSEGKNQNKDQVIFIDNFKGAWCIDSEAFQDYAKRYKIDIRIFVWEMGMEWSSQVTFYRDGKTDSILHNYSDWLWDSPMANLGG